MESLQTAPDGADWPAMTDEEGRGAAIKRRLEALGMSDRDWMDKTGIDIKTVHRAIAEAPGTRASSYLAIEAALTNMEKRFAGTPTADPKDPDVGLVEFRLSGNFGVDVVVKGPIRDREALEESVARLLREMRGS